MGGGERTVEASSRGCGSCVVGAAVGFGWGGPCVGVLMGAVERREEAEGQVRQTP